MTATFMLLGVVGFTVAYFTSNTDFENEFNTGFYEIEATEVFTSPASWLPGDTTPKTLTVKNTGDANVKARVCFYEDWISNQDEFLSSTQNNERVAILNLINTSDWTQKGECYYYNNILEPDDETSSFIESVTFNPNITPNVTCETTTNNNGLITKTCSSTGYGYDNATYKLYFNVETVQASSASEAWDKYVYTKNTVYPAIEPAVELNSSIPNGVTVFYTPLGAVKRDGFHNIPIYLKHRIENNIVTESYLEILITEALSQEYPDFNPGIYSFRGGGATVDEERTQSIGHTVYNNDSVYYEANYEEAKRMFSSESCNLEDNLEYYYCDTSPFSLSIDKTGYVSAWYNGYYICTSDNTKSECATD